MASVVRGLVITARVTSLDMCFYEIENKSFYGAWALRKNISIRSNTVACKIYMKWVFTLTQKRIIKYNKAQLTGESPWVLGLCEPAQLVAWERYP